jgi:hypothetical protein
MGIEPIARPRAWEGNWRQNNQSFTRNQWGARVQGGTAKTRGANPPLSQRRAGSDSGSYVAPASPDSLPQAVYADYPLDFINASAATDLARRPRLRDKAARSGGLPRLVRLMLSGRCGSGLGRLGRSGRGFRCGLGQCGRRLCVVFLETAVFVFAARATMTGLVAAWSCTGWSSH